MNWSSIFLIKFLMVFSLYLKGAVAADNSSSVIYGVLGRPVFLPATLPATKVIPTDLKWLRDKNLLAKIKDKNTTALKSSFDIFLNGTLKINNLTEEDAGTNYKLEIYGRDGKHILSRNVALVVQELLRPQLFLKCSAHIVTCEVTHNLPPRPKLVLLYNNKKQSNTEDYNNGRVSVTYTLKNHSGRFICEASNEANTQRIEKENNCSDPTGDMFFYLIIGGSIVVFIVFLAVLIYCIKKKRAKRRKLEAAERELQTRIAVENGLKYRKLPQPPVRVVSNQPPQQHKLPPPQSEAPLLAGPPQPRPRPHQKPPRRTREKP